ncbi:hypothetical protein F5X96DRAFT_614592 [Biscogniauxia mediterranea]|nr:hypothetical protein F5X96DRAFT_614592 [Biscogniauxia mediterranea]
MCVTTNSDRSFWFDGSHANTFRAATAWGKLLKDSPSVAKFGSLRIAKAHPRESTRNNYDISPGSPISGRKCRSCRSEATREHLLVYECLLFFYFFIFSLWAGISTPLHLDNLCLDRLVIYFYGVPTLYYCIHLRYT